MNNYQETIPNKLRGQRSESRLTQDDVAKAINRSRFSVANWENGTNMIPFGAACELADLYGVPLDRLAGRDQ